MSHTALLGFGIFHLIHDSFEPDSAFVASESSNGIYRIPVVLSPALAYAGVYIFTMLVKLFEVIINSLIMQLQACVQTTNKFQPETTF